MGLDSIDLLIKVEQDYEIKISDSEADLIYTVEDLYTLVLDKLNLKSLQDSKKCKSQQLFYTLRKIISEAGHYPFEMITPSSELIKVFKPDNRKEDWKLISKKTGLAIPDLERPKWIEKRITQIGIGLGIIVLIIAIYEMNPLWLILWGIIPLYWTLATKLTEKFANQIRLKDMKELVEAILSLNYKKLKLSKSSKKEVYWILKGIIALETGTPLHEIKQEAKIVDDLGID